MRHANLRAVCLISLFGLSFVAGAGQVRAQDKPEKVTIAVFDLQGVRTEPTTPIAASGRLREELLKTGHFKLLNRYSLEKKLGEQDQDQLTCMEGDCALKLGRAMGARLVLTGKIVIIDSSAWQISAEITDVASGETVVAGSNIYEGNIVGLISKGVPQLVNKIIPTGDPANYPNIVDFLQQRPPPPSSLPKSAASQRVNARAGKKPPPRARPPPSGPRLPFELKGYRIWISPYSEFTLKFREVNTGLLEKFEGSGKSLGFEVQSNRHLAAGVAIHYGSLETIASPISGRGEEPISGDYQVTNWLVMGAIPRENPWFFIGSGLGYTSIEWNDGGVIGSDTYHSILFMVRLAYTLDSGLMWGGDFQNGLVGHGSGDRYDSLRNQGFEHPKLETAVTSLFLGYSF